MFSGISLRLNSLSPNPPPPHAWQVYGRFRALNAHLCQYNQFAFEFISFPKVYQNLKPWSETRFDSIANGFEAEKSAVHSLRSTHHKQPHVSFKVNRFLSGRRTSSSDFQFPINPFPMLSLINFLVSLILNLVLIPDIDPTNWSLINLIGNFVSLRQRKEIISTAIECIEIRLKSGDR